MKLGKNLKLKLARMVMNFGQVETSGGTLIYEGEPEEGKEVFIASGEDDPVPAPDGNYETDDQVIIVEGGKIAEISLKGEEKDPKVKMEEPQGAAGEAADDMGKAARLVAELQEKLAQLQEEITTLTSSVQNVRTEMAAFRKQPLAKPLSNKPDLTKYASVNKVTGKENKLLQIINS
ncbi:MAG: hypothetical protein LUG98_09975 [Tannerellaceae bacterium]|nr:hypothetical protein [Tannerellaceae bacterium]